MHVRLTEVTLRIIFEVKELPVIIGRDSSVDITLDDPSLPPLQCMIEESAWGQAVIWNLREDFPLYVNGDQVTSAKLCDGDVLTIGRNHFAFSTKKPDGNVDFDLER
jgi:hypothetical protein